MSLYLRMKEMFNKVNRRIIKIINIVIINLNIWVK
jgi:hypothetical protein